MGIYKQITKSLEFASYLGHVAGWSPKSEVYKGKGIEITMTCDGELYTILLIKQAVSVGIIL